MAIHPHRLRASKSDRTCFGGAPVRAFRCLLILVVALAATTTVARAATDMPATIDGATTISAEKLIDLVLGSDRLAVIDARRNADWLSGHIEGAIQMVNTDMTAPALSKVVARSKPVVFYCNGPRCYRSGDAATKAIAWGWKRVYWFRGGVEEWTGKGYPLTR